LKKALIIFIAVLFLLFLAFSTIARAEGEFPTAGSPAPAPGFEDRGAGYLPYSEPSAFGAVGFLGAVLQMVFCLAVVLGLVYAFLWIMRRMMSRSATVTANESIRVMGSIRLNPKSIIYFVRLVDELLVIGTNSGTISLITEIKDERRIAEVENALKGAQSPASGLFFSRFFDRSLLRFQKELERDDLRLDDQIRALDDQIGRLKNLSRKRRSGKD
jgi:flagellar biogenesis protein FliO